MSSLLTLDRNFPLVPLNAVENNYEKVHLSILYIQLMAVLLKMKMTTDTWQNLHENTCVAA